jgi:hypothetical protein
METKFLIWSHRNKRWWKSNREGYTSDTGTAGYYSREEAGLITTGGLPGANIAVDTTLAAKLADAPVEEILAELDFWRTL